jgi:superfamily I DNA and RNA helicase
LATEVVDLQKHYRIGLNICRFADRILPPNLGDSEMEHGCAYDEQARPSSVLTIPCSGDLDQYEKCVADLHRQVRYISDEPILVLSHTQKTRDAFWDVLEADARLLAISVLQSSEGYEAFGPSSLIRVMTIASAKGSEARAVHILKADGLKTGLRELTFTAVTRAKTEVTLYHSTPLPGHLQPQADTLPDIEDIF